MRLSPWVQYWLPGGRIGSVDLPWPSIPLFLLVLLFLGVSSNIYKVCPGNLRARDKSNFLKFHLFLLLCPKNFDYIPKTYAIWGPSLYTCLFESDILKKGLICNNLHAFFLISSGPQAKSNEGKLSNKCLILFLYVSIMKYKDRAKDQFKFKKDWGHGKWN